MNKNIFINIKINFGIRERKMCNTWFKCVIKMAMFFERTDVLDLN